jgi:hypothetical protein
MFPEPKRIKTTVGIYEISTCDTWDRGWETMIFNNVNGDTDVRPEFTKRHANEQKAKIWHEYVVGMMQKEQEEES